MFCIILLLTLSFVDYFAEPVVLYNTLLTVCFVYYFADPVVLYNSFAYPVFL